VVELILAQRAAVRAEIETKLTDLRDAAERYMRDHEPGYGAPAFRDAIEASRTAPSLRL
jgi:hypothetical protein